MVRVTLWFSGYIYMVSSIQQAGDTIHQLSGHFYGFRFELHEQNKMYKLKLTCLNYMLKKLD